METHTLRLLVFQRLERDFPYSLGKPIEWKLMNAIAEDEENAMVPYSLGKPIEWKHRRLQLVGNL